MSWNYGEKLFDDQRAPSLTFVRVKIAIGIGFQIGLPCQHGLVPALAFGTAVLLRGCAEGAFGFFDPGL
jgi:hypothetical protein